MTERRQKKPEDQPDDGLCQHNPEAIVRRGADAWQRVRRGFEDWMDIAEALQIGRAECMRAANTNEPKGKRYEQEMHDWLKRNSLSGIDKAARKRALECLQHRAEIEKWRAILTEEQRASFNHPDTILRKWKKKNVVPDPNAPRKTSAFARLKESLAQVENENARLKRNGGDSWSPRDTAEDIADVMVRSLSTSKAEGVARAILQKLKKQQAA